MAQDGMERGVVEPEVVEEEAAVEKRRLDADTILDAVIPEQIDWRETVRRHPVASIVGVGLVGYVVGRTKGSAILAGITAGISSALMRQLSDVFEGELFDFE